MVTCYVVTGTQGEHSARQTWVVRAFEDKADADAWAAEADAYAKTVPCSRWSSKRWGVREVASREPVGSCRGRVCRIQRSRLSERDVVVLGGRSAVRYGSRGSHACATGRIRW